MRRLEGVKRGEVLVAVGGGYHLVFVIRYRGGEGVQLPGFLHGEGVKWQAALLRCPPLIDKATC